VRVRKRCSRYTPP